VSGQRNFYRPRRVSFDAISWPQLTDDSWPLSSGLAPLTPELITEPEKEHDARQTVVVRTADGRAGGAIVATFQLDQSSLAGNPLYFALEVLLEPRDAQLSLMIDNGSGQWQSSNATRGLACKRDLGLACSELQVRLPRMKSSPYIDTMCCPRVLTVLRTHH
jgi:hypothetical protein